MRTIEEEPFRGSIDPGILDLVHAFCTHPWLTTFESCAGHAGEEETQTYVAVFVGGMDGLIQLWHMLHAMDDLVYIEARLCAESSPSEIIPVSIKLGLPEEQPVSADQLRLLADWVRAYKSLQRRLQ